MKAHKAQTINTTKSITKDDCEIYTGIILSFLAISIIYVPSIICVVYQLVFEKAVVWYVFKVSLHLTINGGAINPIIYIITNSKIREMYKKVWFKLTRKNKISQAPPTQPNNLATVVPKRKVQSTVNN